MNTECKPICEQCGTNEDVWCLFSENVNEHSHMCMALHGKCINKQSKPGVEHE